MADNKTEKPTPRRREKTRKEGKVPRSRELSSAFALMGVICLLHWSNVGWVEQWRDLTDRLLKTAVHSDIDATSSVLSWTGVTALKWAAPACIVGFGVAMVVQFGQGGIVFSAKPFAPKFSKLSPGQNVKQLFSLAGVSR